MSAEYGWSDDVIWNLPLCRFRQITAAILRRQFMQDRAENSRFSWLARNISGFIAAGYMVEKGRDNPAIESAASLAYDNIEAALLGVSTAAPVDSKTPGVRTTGPIEQRGQAPDIDPDEAIARALARNSVGSFNRFMGMTNDLEVRGKMI